MKNYNCEPKANKLPEGNNPYPEVDRFKDDELRNLEQICGEKSKEYYRNYHINKNKKVDSK